MIRLITRENSPLYPDLVKAMHRERKHVFVDMLHWNVPHDGDCERDAFDDDHAEYLILQDRRTGAHRASMRLLDTRRPHLMSELFAHLCDEGVPRGPHIREITRFCVAPTGNAAERRLARNMIVRAMVDYALLTGITAFTAVCNLGFLSEVLSAGWRCRPLGLPRQEGHTLTGALRIDISAETLRLLNANWSCDPVELRLAETVPAIAA